MYIAKVFRVMTGAPSDIKEEINIVRKYINEWNPVNSENKKVVIFPIHWGSNCYPASGISPQKHINTLLTNKSDMMVCIFGATLGTPTDKEISGTVEELKEHVKNNKPAMVYFKISVRNIHEVQPEQLKRIKEFKEKIKDKTFFIEYSSVREFRDRFKSDFDQAVNDCFVNDTKSTQGVIQNNQSKTSPASITGKIISEKKPSTKLKVIFPDGRELEDFYAKNTFVEAIRIIGPTRVMNLGIRRCRVPLVGRQISDKYQDSQVEVENGIYVFTHSSTGGKKRDLDLISQKLDLNLEVHIVS